LRLSGMAPAGSNEMSIMPAEDGVGSLIRCHKGCDQAVVQAWFAERATG
jgi:hypothetical protein